ncbi:MAG: hypothetical protein H7248_04320 [Microbacteriaceae bacterium]|nr:hypothetical protein [Microbacteriaceae bacterium]
MKKSNRNKMPAELVDWLNEQKRDYADGSMTKEHADLLDQKIPGWNLEPDIEVRINVLRDVWLDNGWDGDEEIFTGGFASARKLNIKVGVMEYAAGVSFVFQDRGVWGGIAQVGRNHSSIITAYQLGIEPTAFVEWELPKFAS